MDKKLFMFYSSNHSLITVLGGIGIGIMLGIALPTSNKNIAAGGDEQVDHIDSWLGRIRLRIATLALNSHFTLFGTTCNSSTKTLSPSPITTDFKTTARHIAIIMDGNRRYGKAKHGDALKGHWDGGQTLVDCVKWCMELGVEILTVYAFSTENWKRPPEEIDLLMNIFCKFATKCEEEAMENNIRISVLSTDRERLPIEVKNAIVHMEELTQSNTGFRFNLAVSYGGRSDLVQATQRCIKDSLSGGVLDGREIDDKAIKQRLCTRELPELDILIRTSGERRLSNFLLFECAYSELFFIDKFWPELTRDDLKNVLVEFDVRNRRFGK